MLIKLLRLTHARQVIPRRFATQPLTLTRLYACVGKPAHVARSSDGMHIRLVYKLADADVILFGAMRDMERMGYGHVAVQRIRT